MYSFKINSHVSFPLEGLDLRPFLAKECVSQITTYDLLSVICHHGTAGSKSSFLGVYGRGERERDEYEQGRVCSAIPLLG